MIDIIAEFTEKLKIKKYLFLNNGDFTLFKNIQKDKSDFPREILENKLFEVIDMNKINDEDFYLIADEGSKIGWIKIDEPIFIYQTFPEDVIIIENNISNQINQILGLYEAVNPKTIYQKMYFTVYKNQIYFGIVKNDNLITFLSENQITNGDINSKSFKFKEEEVTLYKDINFDIGSKFINDFNEYHCKKVFKLNQRMIGSFQYGRINYWFNIEDTDIDLNEIITIPVRDKQYYIVEHLFYSQSVERNNMSSISQNKTLEEEVILKRFSDYDNRINELIEENRRLNNILSNENKKQV